MGEKFPTQLPEEIMKPILLVGEARGEVEARMDSSFVGPSGAELLRMLNESGIISFTFAPRPLTRSKVEETILKSKFKQLRERLKL